MSYLNNHSLNSLALTGAFCLASSLFVYSQEALDATHGIIFGPGNPEDPGFNHPMIAKGISDQDLEFDFFANGKMQIFRDGYEHGGVPLPVFQAGEGHAETIESNGVYKWYRIAETLPTGPSFPKRANAQFSLRDDIFTGGNSTAVFRAGISYGDEAGSGVTLLSHTRSGATTTFPKVRIVKGGTHDKIFLEVYIGRTGAVRFSITDNLGNSGWYPVDWEVSPGIPTNYTERQYNIDKSFMVGDSKNRLSVARGGRVDLDGSLYIKGEPVLSQAESDERYMRPLSPGSNKFKVNTDFSIGELGNPALTSINLGYGNTVHSSSGRVFLMGDRNSTLGTRYSQVIGFDSDITGAESSLSVGKNNSVGAVNSSSYQIHNAAVIGEGLLNATSNSLIVGKFNEDLGLESDALFVVGKGTEDSLEGRSNALTVFNNGDVDVFGVLSVAGLAVNGEDVLTSSLGDGRYIQSGGVAHLEGLSINNDFFIGESEGDYATNFELGGNFSNNSLDRSAHTSLIGNSNTVEQAYSSSITGFRNTIESIQNAQVTGRQNLLGIVSNSLVVGSDNRLGFDTNSDRKHNMGVIGKGLINKQSNSTVVGQYNKPIEETLFSVGNGTDSSNLSRSNALEVYKNGDVKVNGKIDASGFTSGGNDILSRSDNLVTLGSSGSGLQIGSGFAVGGSKHSVAWGYSAAFEFCATAWGEFSSASGEYSTAWGLDTDATNDYSTAWGHGAAATGSAATAFGSSTIASGSNSLAIGEYNKADLNALFSVGNGTASKRANALEVHRNGNVKIPGSLEVDGASVLTQGNVAGYLSSGSISDLTVQDTLSLGSGSILTSGSTGFSSGSDSWVNGQDSLAFGNYSRVNGNYSIALGRSNISDKFSLNRAGGWWNTIVSGVSKPANFAFASGNSSIRNQGYEGRESNADYSTALGASRVSAYGNGDSFAKFTVAMGFSSISSNASNVDYATSLGGSEVKSSARTGSAKYAFASGSSSVVNFGGNGSIADYAVALGNSLVQTEFSGDSSVKSAAAIGDSTIQAWGSSNADYAVALGKAKIKGNTVSDISNSTAIQGEIDAQGLNASAIYSTALGGGVVTSRGSAETSDYAFVVGQSRVKGNHSIALGQNNETTKDNAVAIGRGLEANHPKSIIVGTFNKSTEQELFVIGNGGGETPESRSNAVTVLKSGETTIQHKDYVDGVAPADQPKSLVVKGGIEIDGMVVVKEAQGDISMGIYGN